LHVPGIVRPYAIANRIAVPVATSEGRTYSLEFKANLEDPGWTTVTTVIGNGTIRILADPTQREKRVSIECVWE